ncbi:hypothetical protein [Streptomyces sp. VB1]|uniref:hypothetical protein n=1 Tax=Streptomyces sp. VB1 TaxID=2986803 RepID=UPI002242796A|nr:hypothetical protein [Streptomyces sp. VB1]UZI33994.1 hypothetical protein OH133_38370 [Streptomyces sp. VB1]
MARGMPREAIRFIHEAGTDLKKEKLFADCRAGRVRVLIGSTQKMGTGTNIQDRAVALHHLSYPWRPADMAQRDGRIERRGNLNAPWIDNTPDDVRVLYYITERTFDEFRLTTLARKARFIGQIQRREFNLREIEDIGADALNLGMLAALSSGDPAILQLAEATAERSRLQGLARSWDRTQDNRAQDLKDINAYISRAEPALARMREAAPTRRPTAGDAFVMTVDDATYRSRDTAANALGARMAAIAKDQSIRPGQHVPIGTLGGQDFHAEIVYGASGGRQLRLRFPWGNVVPIGHRDDRAQWQASTVTPSNGRGAIQSLEHFLNHLDEDLEKLAASAAFQNDRSVEIFVNLRSKDDNPYRIQARSKEREERALSKLVVANEKEQGLAERAERAANNSPDGQAEEEDEELTALREQIAKLRKAVEDEHRIQEQAAALARGETSQEPAPDSEAGGSEPATAEAAGTGTGEATTTPSSTGPDVTATGPQDQPRPEQPPADPDTEHASETGPEQQFQQALDELLSGTGAEPEESGTQDHGPAAEDDDPVLAQIIAHDMGALAGEGWTEVVRPFTSQREAAFEQAHVQVVYERWAATQTALPMLVDADEELADEAPGITNPAGLVASWAYRARLAAASAGPTGGRTVVEQYEGLARAARRADSHLEEQDAYVLDDDRALLLQVANTADQYAQRLAATLDVLAQQVQERQETESQAEVRMRELQVLENAMEYLRDQGSDFRMDRQNATITDREAAGTQLRDDLLRVMRELGELPAERQNLDPDFRVAYANIRGIPLYVGWSDPGTPQARAVLGFDQLPLLDRDSFTAAELEATPPTQLIDRLDGRLDLDTLEAVRDRDREAIQDLLAAGAQGQQAPATDDAPTAQSGEATADAQQPEQEVLGEEPIDEAVPEGYQPFSDESVQLEPGDVIRRGARQYMEDRHLRYRTVTVIEGPDPRDGYYQCGLQSGGHIRVHPRDIVAVPDGSRLLPGNAPEQQEPTAPAAQEAPEEAPATKAAPLQGLIDALGDRVSLTHIGGPQSADEPAAEEPAAPAPAEAEQHTEPAPEIARIAAVLRYYEPLLKRAYIDRPGVGYSYDPDNPLLDLVNEIGKVGERVGGTFRRSYNEWVTYEVGARRAAQSEQLTNLNIDLLTLYSRQTEPLFEVDLETILAAPPGTVIDLPEETAPEQAPSAIVIHHDAEGTTVKGTRKDDQPVRNALKDQGFRWSRRQSMWYLRRDTPLDARADAVRGLRDFLDRIGTAYTAFYDGAPAPAPQDTEEAAEAPQETAPAPDTSASSAETSGHPVGWTIAALLSQRQLKTLVSAYVVDSQPVPANVKWTERVRDWIAVQQQTPTTAWYASPSSDLPEALRGNGDVRLSSGRDGITLEQGGQTTLLPWEEIPAWIEAAAAHDEANRGKRAEKRTYGRLDREVHFRSDDPQTLRVTRMMADLDAALRNTAPPSQEQLAAARDRFGPHPQEPSAESTAEAAAVDSAETAVDQSGTSEGDPAEAGPQGSGQDSAPPSPEASAEPEADSADEPEEGDEAPADAAEGMVIVQTPEGPGRVVGTDGDLVLVSTQSGTRVYEGDEVQWPEGTTRPEDGDFAAKRRRNEADLAQASTAEGIELNYGDGNRLVDLDVEAGHGTVVDADGAVVGWVRARLGDDGRRYWWGQDAQGGPPDSMPFHEALPPSAGVPAIRAAGHVRTGLTSVKEPAHRRPITAEYASREVRLTTAQVRELRRLTLDATYSDGTPVEPPEWVAGHRKYQLNVAQMQALGEAAQAAADAFPGVTAEERRTAKVLRNAAEHFEFEVYDTARWRATIPPIGESDPYAGPFQPRPRAEASEDTQTVPETAPVVVQAADPAPTQNSGPEPTVAEEATITEPGLVVAADPQAAAEEENQLGLFPNETPDAPAPHRPARRRGTRKTEPAAPPGTEGAEAGRLGVYGHADHGECERCGTADTDRYTVVWHWFAPDQGEMAAECAPCVELTTGLSRTEITRHADVAEAQRGGLRVQPRPLHQDLTTIRRTADNEWTAVHLPTGTRFRSARESESGYRGYVTRDLNGVSHGVGPGVATDVALRAALGHTAETHPNSGDNWVFFSYQQDAKKVLLHDGEALVSHTNGRRTEGPYEHGPRWDLTIAGSTYVVEMVYQQGQPGNDGHRLEVTGPDQSSTRHVQWDGALEWAREHARGVDTAPANGRTASPPTESEQASTESNDQVARSSWGLVDGERIRYTGQGDGRYELTLPGTSYLLFLPSVEYRRSKYAVSLNDQDPGITPKRLRRFTDPDEIIPWVRAHASKQQTGYVFRNGTWVEVPPVEQDTLPDGETAADDRQAAPAQPALTPPASAPEAAAQGEPAPGIEPVNEPSDETVRPQPASVPAREPGGAPDQEDTVAGEPDLASHVAAPEPSAVGESPALDVEDPPAPQSYTEVFPLPLDAGYQLHLTGLDGQGFSEGELKIGESTIAVVRLSASDRWFARLTADGLTADVTMLNGSPQEAAAQAAMMFAAVTGTPYGARPGPAVDYGPLTRVDVLRGEMKSTALGHLGAITNAVARVNPDYTQIREFQELSARLNALAAADAEAHDSQRMAADLDAVQGATNAWGGSLPADPALDERQHLAFPLAHLLYDVTRLHTRLQATLDAARAERVAAAAAPTESVSEEQAQQAPDPAAPQRVRGPVAVLGLREVSEGQIVAMLNTVEASQALVLPGVTSADLPGMPLPVRVEVPMLVRQPQQAEQMVSDEETHAWLAGHLADGPLAQAWNTDAVRQAMVAVAADVLRDGMAPSVDDVAAWLVATAPEQDGLLQAAHDAPSVADFAPAFARAADNLVADGGSEPLVWRYLGDSEGHRRLDVLALATPGAYEQLRALPASALAPGAELTSPITETPEDPTMATPAQDDVPPEEQQSAGEAPQPTRPVASIQLRQAAGGTLLARVTTPNSTRARSIRPGPLRRGGLPELALLVTAEVPLPPRTDPRVEALVQGAETEQWLSEHLEGGPMEPALKVREVETGLGDLLRDVLLDDMAPSAGEIATWLAGAIAEDDDLLRVAHKVSLEDFTRQGGFARAADDLVVNNESALLRWAYSGRNEGGRKEVLALAAPDAYGRLRAKELPQPSTTEPLPLREAAAAEEFTLDADSRYRLRLSAVDGEGPREGDLLYGDAAVATVRLSADGRWFARLTADGLPADVTMRNDSPQDAAHQGAIMFAVTTGEPFGDRPIAADARGGLSRADVLRRELSTAADWHRRIITGAAALVNQNYAYNPQFLALNDQLGTLAATDVDSHGSWQMADNLEAIKQAAISWGGVLPQDPTDEERQRLAFPLANVLYEATRLHERLQATLDAEQADRAAAREQQEAAAPAPAEPARDDSTQQTPAPEPVPMVEPPTPTGAPSPERAADGPSTDQPAPLTDVPEDPDMTTPVPPRRSASEPEAPAPQESSPLESGAADQTAQPTTPQDRSAGNEGGAWDGDGWDLYADPSLPGDLPLHAEDAADDWSVRFAWTPDMSAEFDVVREAWDKLVPADKGTSEELSADVQADLAKLQQGLADAVTASEYGPEAPAPAVEPAVPAAESVPAVDGGIPASGEQETRAERNPKKEADAVNTALREADGHAPDLQALPEWQRIQTVRGAFGNLMSVIKERAGEHFGKLMKDKGVSDFVRRVSLRVCEKIAGWAQTGADRLRQDDKRSTEQRDEVFPSAEALLRLGDAAFDYRGLRSDGGAPLTSLPVNQAPDVNNIPAMRKMGEALNRPLPGRDRVSAATARGRSTTTGKPRAKGAKKSASGGDQAGHLRRAEQQTGPKPNTR